MQLKIFQWEQDFIDFTKTWPESGLFYDLMDFVSDFGANKWILVVTLATLFAWKGWREVGLPIGLSALAVGFSDLISHRLIQAYFMRPRPWSVDLSCNVCDCWGFVSSHASNAFAVVGVLYCLNKKTLFWSLPLATVISFSRVFLRSHYPLDVIGGSVAGLTIGFTIFVIYKYSRNKMTANRYNPVAPFPIDQ